MKQIKLAKIKEDVKKEYEVGKDWCSLDWRHYYKIMIDTDDGDIWSDAFISDNEWKVYHSDSIHPLAHVPGKGIVASYIDCAVDYLRAAGWEVKDDAE